MVADYGRFEDSFFFILGPIPSETSLEAWLLVSN